jgi:hypothetical protein
MKKVFLTAAALAALVVSPALGADLTSGPLVGGQLGCDYQFAGGWVIGIQGSVAGAYIDGTGFENPPDNGISLDIK